VSLDAVALCPQSVDDAFGEVRCDEEERGEGGGAEEDDLLEEGVELGVEDVVGGVGEEEVDEEGEGAAREEGVVDRGAVAAADEGGEEDDDWKREKVEREKEGGREKGRKLLIR
jgi:hypothetical protein